MSLNLIDQAALRKRIDDLLSNPVESAKELEQLRLKLADSQKHVTLLRDTLFSIRDGSMGLWGDDLINCNKALSATYTRSTK